MPSVSILPIIQEQKGADDLLRSALQLTSSRLLLYFFDSSQAGPDAQILSLLGWVYDVTGVDKPCLDVVPLFPFAGWKAETVAGITSVDTILVPTTDGAAKQAADKLVALRPSDLPKLATLDISPPQKTADEPGAPRDAPGEISSVEVVGAKDGDSLCFDRVAVGGTFDRLHAGHRMLLATTALVSTSSIYLGITGDKLLRNKTHAELLQSYKARENASSEFLRSVRPGLDITTGALLDPEARTAAATDPKMEALVVSQETRTGADAINQDREQHGFLPLALVIVTLVAKGSKALGGGKLSSTALRAKEAEQAKTKS